MPTTPSDEPLAASPSRLLSLYPSATEIVLALGEGHRLVARTDFDTDPRLATLPSLGASLTPGLESIVDLRPDLIIVSPSDDLGGRSVARLRELGFRLQPVQIHTSRDVLDSVRGLGEVLGVPRRADSLATALESELAAISERNRDCAPVTALYVLWADPAWTAGPDTYIDELMAATGARNVFRDAAESWPQVSLEEVVARDPDFLILPVLAGSGTVEPDLRGLAGWGELDAVRDGRVLRVEADLFNRPGPRVTEAAKTLAGLLDAHIPGRCAR